MTTVPIPKNKLASAGANEAAIRRLKLQARIMIILAGCVIALLITILVIFFFFDEKYAAYSLVSDEIQRKYGGGVMSYTDSEATWVGLASLEPKKYSVRVYSIRPDGSTRMCGGMVLKDPTTKELVLESADCYGGP
jgi:hypothetical protein